MQKIIKTIIERMAKLRHMKIISTFEVVIDMKPLSWATHTINDHIRIIIIVANKNNHAGNIQVSLSERTAKFDQFETKPQG